MNFPDISQDSTTTQPQSSRELPKAPTRPPLRCSTKSSIPPKYYGQGCGTYELKRRGNVTAAVSIDLNIICVL